MIMVSSVTIDNACIIVKKLFSAQSMSPVHEVHYAYPIWKKSNELFSACYIALQSESSISAINLLPSHVGGEVQNLQILLLL